MLNFMCIRYSPARALRSDHVAVDFGNVEVGLGPPPPSARPPPRRAPPSPAPPQAPAYMVSTRRATARHASERANEDAKAQSAQASWWRERIAWYPDGCFGPYRPSNVGYSRRELAADGAVHILGVLLGCIGVTSLYLRLGSGSQLSQNVIASLVVYGASLLFAAPTRKYMPESHV